MPKLVFKAVLVAVVACISKASCFSAPLPSHHHAGEIRTRHVSVITNRFAAIKPAGEGKGTGISTGFMRSRHTQMTRRDCSAAGETQPILKLDVCHGPSCQGACYNAVFEAVEERFKGQVEVGKTDCFNACKRSPSVRVLGADGKPRALAGMGMQETKKFCFSMVKEDAPDERMLEVVRRHLDAEPHHSQSF